MKEEFKCGGGSYKCSNCGKTVFGSVICECTYDKIKIEDVKDSNVDWEDPVAELEKKDRIKPLTQAFLELYKIVSGKKDVTIEDVIKEYMVNNPIDPLFTEALNEMEGKEKPSKERFVDQNKPHLTLFGLKLLVDKYVSEGYKDTPVYFDTEGRSFGCHIVKVQSLHVIPEEAMGKNYVVLTMDMDSVIEDLDKPQFTEEQIKVINDVIHKVLWDIKEHNDINMKEESSLIEFHRMIMQEFNGSKQEEPLIVHNVMSYNDKNYLKQPSGKHCHGCAFRMDVSSERCMLQETIAGTTRCDQYTIWKSFDDIEITDELACMRKDIGDIYIVGSLTNPFILCKVIDDKVIIHVPTYPKQFKVQITSKEHLRLATTEELQEYFKNKK